MVYSFFEWQFWFFLFLTPIAFFVSFYLPGSFFVERLKPKSASINLLLSTILGLCMWGIQGFVFGYLHLRFLTYVYLIAFGVLFILHWADHQKVWQRFSKELRTTSKLTLTFLVIGIIMQVIPMIASGMMYSKGVEYFFTNAVDGVMHLAYIQSIVHTFPPQEPGLSGFPIINYHYWSDLILAEMVRVWQIPVSLLFFQFVPFFISFLTGCAAYAVLRIWKLSRAAGRWSLFFLFFGGDAAYIFTLILHRQFGFQTPAIDNGVTQFLNMPHVFAKLVFLTGIIPFSYWLQTKKPKWLILSIIMFMCLAGLKIYFSMFAAVGICMVVFLQICHSLYTSKATSLQRKLSETFQRHWLSATLIGVLGIGSFIIYYPANHGSGGLFYSPLEWPKIFLAPDALDFRIWWLRMQVYQATNKTIGIAILNLIAIIICLVCVYGTRLLGLVRNKMITKKIGWELYAFFFPGIILFTLLGLFTLQVSGLFNVFNFFAVAAVGLALFSAIICDDWMSSKKPWAVALVVLTVLISLPRPINEVYSAVHAYAINHYDYLFSNDEVEALHFIRFSTPQNTLIEASYHNENDRYTPYVSFFSDRTTFLSGDRLLDSHNQPYQPRQAILKNIFAAADSHEFAQRLKEQHIQVVYLVKRSNGSEDLHFTLSTDDFTTLFENNGARVLQVK